ncbi:MAG: FAD-dependent oxidoreductase, partial [Pseudomonadota bacterium]
MSYTTFSVEIDSDGIAVLTIDLPGQSMNVLNQALINELETFVTSFVSDEAMTGLVIASGKKSGFVAGADLRMLASTDPGAGADDGFAELFRLNKILRTLETGGHSAKALMKGEVHAKPVAAIVDGLALGGGLELVLACHYKLASDNPKVQFGVPEVQVGLLPGGGGTQRIPRLAGLQNAAMMITQGTPVNAVTAKQYNLIHDIVPGDELVDNAKAWIKANPKVTAPWDQKKFKFPGGGGAMDPRAVQFFMAATAMAQDKTYPNYPAVEHILSCLYEGSIVPFDTAIRIESKYFGKLLTGDQSRNMIRTLFINKQAAEKGEQRPANVGETTLKKVGVLGAGMMGAGIAYVTAKAGMEVVLLDRDQDYAEKGKGYSQKIVEKGVSRGKVTKEKGDGLLARIT